jgi:hypothetical protein
MIHDNSGRSMIKTDLLACRYRWPNNDLVGAASGLESASNARNRPSESLSGSSERRDIKARSEDYSLDGWLNDFDENFNGAGR